MRTFDTLVSEALAADVTGWSFTWLDGRATEQRPPWGYANLLAQRLSTANAGLALETLRTARCRMEFYDIGAVIWTLRKCPWWVPGFSVEDYPSQLQELDGRFRRGDPFVAHSTRHLIVARKPD
ncbi:hypothetical protein GCM10009689_11250 [Brevibacterium antiquum]|uniref:hypothetical protein n=1 Tax=Brevibacterium antiquum TaxID=234835 RepID=UPI0018E01690|nr:hypothetical protein [Brevibacterium antiquum]